LARPAPLGEPRRRLADLRDPASQGLTRGACRSAAPSGGRLPALPRAAPGPKVADNAALGPLA
jgi:hypothetical protein